MGRRRTLRHLLPDVEYGLGVPREGSSRLVLVRSLTSVRRSGGAGAPVLSLMARPLLCKCVDPLSGLFPYATVTLCCTTTPAVSEIVTVTCPARFASTVAVYWFAPGDCGLLTGIGTPLGFV